MVEHQEESSRNHAGFMQAQYQSCRDAPQTENIMNANYMPSPLLTNQHSSFQNTMNLKSRLNESLLNLGWDGRNAIEGTMQEQKSNPIQVYSPAIEKEEP